MMLSGREIMRQQGRGLQITPFDEKNINPNSYNLTLHDELLVYKNHHIVFHYYIVSCYRRSRDKSMP